MFMSYEIGYASIGESKVSVTQQPSARLALKTVLALDAGGELIRYVRAPAGDDIEIGELHLLAYREEYRIA
jgi:hypothetical protein